MPRPTQNGHELVAAPAHHQISGSGGLFEHAGYQPQGFVTGAVTVAVVDTFEFVNIDQNNRNRFAAIPALEPGTQCLSSRATGERIGLGEPKQVVVFFLES